MYVAPPSRLPSPLIYSIYSRWVEINADRGDLSSFLISASSGLSDGGLSDGVIEKLKALNGVLVQVSEE